MKKGIKVIFIVLAVLGLIFGLVIIFISPITKYVIEKYDVRATGREIKLDWAYVNPFTGYVYLDDFLIYEEKSDSVFISTEGLSFTLDMWKLLSANYEIDGLTLENARGRIVQIDKHHVNYGSLLDHFSSSDSTSSDTSKVHFKLTNVKIVNATLYYIDKLVPVNYFVKKLNLESSGYSWDVDSIDTKFSFASGPSTGDIRGHFTMNLSNLNYRLGAVVHKFDLKIFEQYLNAISNYGTLSANLDANILARGNFHNAVDLDATGFMAINDFHFGKNPQEDYASFDRLLLDIVRLNPKGRKYIFDSIILTKPYFKYEQYDHLDNIETMFGEKGSNVAAGEANEKQFNLIIEIANYIRILAENLLHSYYKADRIAVENANIQYNDFSISEKFGTGLNPLNISAESVDKNNPRVRIRFTSGLKPYGSGGVQLNINPKDYSDFEMTYALEQYPAAQLNPYLLSYTSFPFDRGSITAKGDWKVHSGAIKRQNHLVIVDPRVSKRLKNKDTKWLPLPFIMALIRERGNVIDYSIPITGNLKDPKFHLRDVIFDLLKNVFVKPATTGYRMEVKTVENRIEKSFALKWEMRYAKLLPHQERFVNKLADFLVANPSSSINVQPDVYAEKEKEYIAFFEAKKRYYLRQSGKKADALDEDDLEKIDKMSAKEQHFVAYLDKSIGDTNLIFTIQEKCRKLVGRATIDRDLQRLNAEREQVFLSYFKSRGAEKQVHMLHPENTLPYNGFSFYRIGYKGDRPEELQQAHKELDKLDNQPPREEYKAERKKNKWWQLKRKKND